jgi:hypothetical protein
LPAVIGVGAIAAGVSVIRLVGEFLLSVGPASDIPTAWGVLTFSLGVIQHLAGLVLVVPLTVYVTAEAWAGRPSSPRSAIRAGWTHLGRTAHAMARPLVAIALLMLLPFGIVPAAYLTVRWLFVPQAVLLDGANPETARRLSARAIQRYPRRTIILAGVLVFPIFVFGPVIGMLLLIYAGRSVALVNVASGLVYSVAYPLIVIAATLFYLDRRVSASPDAAPFPHRQ